jgi:mRNA interferase MazF
VRLRPPRRARGREQRAARYGVVLQAADVLDLSTILVAPTSTRAQAATFRPEIVLGGERTRVLVDQLTALASERLLESRGVVGHGELRAIDEALTMVLGLAA